MALRGLLALAVLAPWLALGEAGSPLPSTAFTRQFLAETTAANARARLGIASTNQTTITNFITDASQINTGTLPLARVTLVTSNAPGLASTNLFSAAAISLANRRSAATPRPMGFTFDSSTSQTIVSNTVLAMVANGMVGAGYNNCALNMGVFTNRVNGALTTKPNYFPIGIPNLVSNVALLGCTLGFMLEANFNGNTNDSQDAGTAILSTTAYADGFQIGAWGLRTFWLSVNDTAGGYPLSDLQFLTERLVAGMDDGVMSVGGRRPVYLRGGISYFYPQVPSLFNSVYSHPYGDLNTLGASAYKDALLWTATSNAWVYGPSCARSVDNIPHSALSSWFNTNWCRVGVGMAAMAEPQLFLQAAEYGSLTATELSIFTNADAIAIFQDKLSVPITIVSSNASQIVATVPLYNGDVALGLWNLLTDATTNFSVSIASLPGIRTNSVYALDVFGRTGTNVLGTLTATVNTNGFNLYRLSAVKGATQTVIDSLGNVSTYVNGILVSYSPMLTLDITNGLKVWLKADANTYADGTATNWLDSSGLSNHATNTANFPLYSNSVINGKPAYYLAGAEFWSTPYTAADSNITAFVVYRPRGATAQTYLFDKNSDAGGPTLQQATAAYVRSYVQVSGCQLNGLSSNVWYEAGMRRDGTNFSTWALSQRNDCNQSNAGAFPASLLYIGSKSAGGSGFFTGNMAEVIYYNTSLSDAEISSVRAYLANKYNLHW